MRNNIYISTSVFKDKTLKKILGLCLENGLTNLELGSNVNYSEDDLDIMFKLNGNAMKFLIHNYFPRPKEDFVLNLASNDTKVLSKSIAHCKCAIDLSVQLGAPFYSVHAGFAFHARPEDLGRSQIDLPRIPYRQAYRIFVESIAELANYALRKKVKLGVENNVVPSFNLVNGRNEIALLADAKEALTFYEDISSTNLFYLIDFGHLKATSAALGFDRDEYIKEIIPCTLGFHLSDNDGLSDQHLPFDEGVWFKDIVKSHREKTLVIEAHNMDLEQVRKCYLSVVNILN